MKPIDFKLAFTGNTHDPEFTCQVAGQEIPNITGIKVDIPVDGIPRVSIDILADGAFELNFPAGITLSVRAVDGVVERERLIEKNKFGDKYIIRYQPRLPETS